MRRIKRDRRHYTAPYKANVRLCGLALTCLVVLISLGGIKGHQPKVVEASSLITPVVKAVNIPTPKPSISPKIVLKKVEEQKSWTESQVRDVVSKLFPANAQERFMRILSCENGTHQFDRINRNKDGSTDLGLAQINDHYHRAKVESMFGESFESAMRDPWKNLQYAAYLYRDWGNFNAWVCNRIIN